MSNKTNEVRDALRRLIDKEGVSCLRDAGRFRSLWMDYVPQSKEAKLILSAVQEGVGSTLLAAKDQDAEGQRQSIKRCEQQMVEAFITEEGARYAVREIASALNIDVDRIMPIPAGAGNGAPPPRRGPGSVSRQVQEPAAPAGRQEIYPGQERYPRQQERQNEEFPAGSAFRETPAKKKSKFPWILLVLLLLIGGAAAGIFLTRGNDTVPPVDVETEEEDVPAVVPPVVLHEEGSESSEEESISSEEVESVTPEETVPAVIPIGGVPEETPAEPVQQGYEIDTVVYNLDSIKSMVMDDENTIYYVSGQTVYSTKSDTTLDLSESQSSYIRLAFDPYNSIVYLLFNDGSNNPVIYDITNFEQPQLVLDKENCPGLSDIGEFQTNGEHTYTVQISIYSNGALLVRGTSKTFMVNIAQKVVTPTTSHIYESYGGIVLDDVAFLFTDEVGIVYGEAINGSRTRIVLEQGFLGGAGAYAKHGMIYCYDSYDDGVKGYFLDGRVVVLIPLEDIQVKDYQSLHAKIGELVVGTEDHIAFYDRNLKCIRMIQPAGTNAG